MKELLSFLSICLFLLLVIQFELKSRLLLTILLVLFFS